MAPAIDERLRRAREQQGWTVAVLAARTGVRESLLASIDRGAFEELPTGLYGRAAVRAYASAVGLDVHAVLDEVAPRLPDGEDPLDGLARVHGLTRRRRVEPVVRVPAPEPPAASPHDRPAWHSAGAAVIDSLLLVAVNAVVWALTSAVLGVSSAVALEQAAPALCMLWTFITGVYFVLLGGIRNSTPGTALLAPGAPRGNARGLTLGSSVARGLRCAFEESSITVQWLVGSEQGQQWLRTLRQLRA